jgi:hypothetical protein
VLALNRVLAEWAPYTTPFGPVILKAEAKSSSVDTPEALVFASEAKQSRAILTG